MPIDWSKDKPKCVEACGLSSREANQGNVEALKKFCNSAAGSGKPVMDEFLAATGVVAPPEWCVEYRENLREAARRDVEREGELTKIFEKQGLDK